MNSRSNSFIRAPARIPEDLEYEDRRRELFMCAEREIPFPSPMFDLFVLAAYRVLFDPESRIEQEYEFYAAMAQQSGGIDYASTWQTLIPSAKGM